jgi:hypothetical protein
MAGGLRGAKRHLRYADPMSSADELDRGPSPVGADGTRCRATVAMSTTNSIRRPVRPARSETGRSTPGRTGDGCPHCRRQAQTSSRTLLEHAAD